MAMYHDGYGKAKEEVRHATLPELLQTLDNLFGRDKVEDESDSEEVRAEALRQVQCDFLDTYSPEYAQLESDRRFVKAMKGMPC